MGIFIFLVSLNPVNAMNPLNSIRIFEVAGFRFRVMARSLLLDEMANLKPFQLSGTAGREDALLFTLEQEEAYLKQKEEMNYFIM